uniref:Uncharacterized protein n=1 Tax=Knipowitschia caucasica TaxID=637954 RepID=A0AAV2KJW5_KNICA
MAHIDTAVISKTVIVPRAHLWPPPPASGPRLGARPTPLRDPGAHNFNPGAGWSSLPGQLPDPFPYRAELDLPVPQRRNCSPTPTKKEHRGPSRLKPPLGFQGPIAAPCSRVWERLECVCARSPCVRKTDHTCHKETVKS